jgi:mRNA-degrading endonuclease toxin of MazEF toxin-antitoxin module
VTVGEIRWVEMPARGGHAQAGRRPAVIAQSATGWPTILVVPLTSQLDAPRFTGTVLVEADSQNSLRRPSVALGSVSKEVLEAIWSALDKLTGR